eukprot:scaffold2735_cov114-Isochrysis_galbana.AAC.2
MCHKPKVGHDEPLALRAQRRERLDEAELPTHIANGRTPLAIGRLAVEPRRQLLLRCGPTAQQLHVQRQGLLLVGREPSLDVRLRRRPGGGPRHSRAPVPISVAAAVTARPSSATRPRRRAWGRARSPGTSSGTQSPVSQLQNRKIEASVASVGFETRRKTKHPGMGRGGGILGDSYHPLPCLNKTNYRITPPPAATRKRCFSAGSDLHQFITHPFNLLPITLEQRPHGVALESSRGLSTQPIDVGGDSPQGSSGSQSIRGWESASQRAHSHPSLLASLSPVALGVYIQPSTHHSPLGPRPPGLSVTSTFPCCRSLLAAPPHASPPASREPARRWAACVRRALRQHPGPAATAAPRPRAWAPAGTARVPVSPHARHWHAPAAPGCATTGRA